MRTMLTILMISLLFFSLVWAEGDRDDLKGVAGDIKIQLDPNYTHFNVFTEMLLYDNGPLVNRPGSGAGVPDSSVLQNSSLGMSTLGFGHQFGSGNRMADDFTISGPEAWKIDSLSFYAYQTNSPITSTITGVYYQIWDGRPDDSTSSVIYGDLTTNQIISTKWSNIYRMSETTIGTTRPLMKSTVSCGITLPPGTYWIDWMADGSLSSGPWASPITINGQATTGNAWQYSSGGWHEALDTGAQTQQGLPFLVFGSQQAAKLLISEFVVTPTAGEFVEIFNPNPAPVVLSDYYLTDATFAGNTYYYQIVEGGGGGSFSSDFHVRFPDMATIQPGEYQTVAMNGTAFMTEYGIQPTYELFETDPTIPDMREATPGSIGGSPGLSNAGEIVILYNWDGMSDLVGDVDYVVWGDKAEAVDKTGVRIDGPDPGTDSTEYLPDTPIANQIAASPDQPHAGGNSLHRIDFTEGMQVSSGGNGVSGADETSEDTDTTFTGNSLPSPNAPYLPVGSDVIVTAQIGGDSQYRNFWVNGSWDAGGFYDPNWSGPLLELNDNGTGADSVAGDGIFTGTVYLAADPTNTYNWWCGSEDDANSFLENGVGFDVLGSGVLHTDTLVVDGDGGINQWVVALPGDFNTWNNANDMTRNGTEWSITMQLDAGTYEYKYAVMHQWNAAYGSGGIGGAGSNYSFTAPENGDYIFTFDDADNSQSVVSYIAPIFMDDFEAYTAGTALALQNPTVWTTWSNAPGGSEDPLVSTAHALSGVNSVNIIPNNDCVKLLGNYITGVYKISFFLYVPTGNGAYFNTLQQAPPSAIWGMQVYFEQNGQGAIDGGGARAATFTYANDTWLHNEVIVDLNADTAQYWLNGNFVHGWQWTLGTFGTAGPLQLAANNFFGGGVTGLTVNYYLDDYSITRLDVVSGIIDPTLEIPTEFALDQNYPNPFNPTTTIKYALKENANVVLKIYNMLGQEVRTLVNTSQEAGYKSMVWDGLNNRGARVASGIYIYRIQAGDFVQARKMILMK